MIIFFLIIIIKLVLAALKIYLFIFKRILFAILFPRSVILYSCNTLATILLKKPKTTWSFINDVTGILGKTQISPLVLNISVFVI